MRPETEHSISRRLMTTVVFIGKLVVLAGVVDVQVGVADVADVAGRDAVAGELALQRLVVGLEAAHAERFHDGVVAEAGVDDDRVLAAEDQEAVGVDPRAAGRSCGRGRGSSNSSSMSP